MSDSRRLHNDQQLLRRIRGEFLDMPGLRLTCAQAGRLFGLNEDTCRFVLDALVADEFLACTSSGMYVMQPSGHSAADVRRRDRAVVLRRTA